MKIKAFLLFAFVIAFCVVVGLFYKGKNSPSRGVAQSSGADEDYSRLIGQAIDEAGSSDNSKIRVSMNAIVDGLSDSERAKAMQSSRFFEYYMELNSYDAITSADSKRRVQEALAANDIYNSSFTTKVENGIVSMNKGDYLVENMGINELVSLADIGFDFSQISPEILKKRLQDVDSYNEQDFRDRFGKYLDQTSGGFEEINQTYGGASPAQIETITEALQKIVTPENGGSLCFGDFKSETITPDVVYFCHETYKFFDKIYEKQKKQLAEGSDALASVKGQSSLSLEQCSIQMNFESNRKGSPFLTKKEKETKGKKALKSSAFYYKKIEKT